MSPLRGAVETCLGYDAAFTEEDLVRMSGCTLRGAKGYVVQLVNRRVLKRTKLGLRPGRTSRVQKWLAERPKTKPGGNSRRYRAAKAARDRLAVVDWQRKRGLTNPEEEPVENDGEVEAVDTAPANTMTAAEAAARLRVSTWTIRRYIKSGKLKGYRLPSGIYRVERESVEALLEPVRAAG